MNILWLDTETYSEVPINRGTDRYTRSAEVMIISYAIDDGPVQVIDLTDRPLTDDLLEALNDPKVRIYAHNVSFDRMVLKHALGFDIPIERWRCSSSQARAHALPAALGLLTEVLQVKRKINGKDHIQLFCKPRPANMKRRRADAWSHPTEWAEFLAYAAGDIEAMRAAVKAMPRRNYMNRELRLFFADQRINERGFYCDVEFAEKAVELLKADKRRLDDDIEMLTDGAVTAATQRDRLIIHLLNEYGIILPTLRAKELEKVLDDETVPEEVKELIRIRIQAAMASTAKFTRLLNCVGPDGRMRFTLQCWGAERTGRWSGRTFQPQNLPRPTLKAEEVEQYIELIREGNADSLELLGLDVKTVCSSALRGLLIAPPGRKLIINDWSNIEGRLAAWHAGEEWKLQAFRDFDTIIGYDEKGKPIRKGKDLYILAIAKAYNRSPDLITKDERQQGKALELSMGYGGGVNAFVVGATNTGLDLEVLGEQLPNVLPMDVLLDAEKVYQWAKEKRRTYGLSQRAYVACEALKTVWRHANPKIAQVWRDIETCVRNALNNPGEAFYAARCVFTYAGNWLMIRLPSGRYLMYASPKVLPDGTITYAGRRNKDWKRIKSYGGKFFENIVQASARDILVETILEMDDYTQCVDPEVFVVLHVHDEVVVEAPDDGRFNLADLQEIMNRTPEWAEGLPLATDGFEAKRYAKH